MKNIKNFNDYTNPQVNEWFGFGKKRKREEEYQKRRLKSEEDRQSRLSQIDPNDTSPIPFADFWPDDITKKLIDQKIKVLENTTEFKEIMDDIENGEIKDVRELPTKNYYQIGQTYQLILNDGRLIDVRPTKTWENSSGDYDSYYIMIVDDEFLGYISYINYKLIGKIYDQHYSEKWRSKK
ncbi:hypothetical protein [Trichloromonas sp.]|uniref:hypothetical protein n=1 Tax=Trichloromonas sp. TaxID=3069249 RepID=UPI002A377F66|nr:hypothetical protein [Trichloromonas sp.]